MVTEPLKAKLQTIRQQTTFATNGQIQNSYAVQFTVGDHGPFTVTIPSDKFNAAAVLEAMNKFVTEVNQIQAGA